MNESVDGQSLVRLALHSVMSRSSVDLKRVLFDKAWMMS